MNNAQRVQAEPVWIVGKALKKTNRGTKIMALDAMDRTRTVFIPAQYLYSVEHRPTVGQQAFAVPRWLAHQNKLRCEPAPKSLVGTEALKQMDYEHLEKRVLAQPKVPLVRSSYDITPIR